MSGYIYDPSTFLTFCAMMENSSQEERERFVERSRSMPYEEFLATPYWGCIRGWMLHLHKKCHFCGTIYRLSVHHLTYDHRGEEWNHLEDLQLLCRDCHASKHGLANFEQIEKIYKRRVNAWRYPVEESTLPEEPARITEPSRYAQKMPDMALTFRDPLEIMAGQILIVSWKRRSVVTSVLDVAIDGLPDLPMTTSEREILTKEWRCWAHFGYRLGAERIPIIFAAIQNKQGIWFDLKGNQLTITAAQSQEVNA